MTKWDLLEVLFDVAYQHENAGSEIKKILRENFPMVESEHTDALFHFCNTLNDNSHPMLWGMVRNAWKEFILEQMENNNEIHIPE